MANLKVGKIYTALEENKPKIDVVDAPDTGMPRYLAKTEEELKKLTYVDFIDTKANDLIAQEGTEILAFISAAMDMSPHGKGAKGVGKGLTNSMRRLIEKLPQYKRYLIKHTVKDSIRQRKVIIDKFASTKDLDKILEKELGNFDNTASHYVRNGIWTPQQARTNYRELIKSKEKVIEKLARLKYDAKINKKITAQREKIEQAEDAIYKNKQTEDAKNIFFRGGE